VIFFWKLIAFSTVSSFYHTLHPSSYRLVRLCGHLHSYLTSTSFRLGVGGLVVSLLTFAPVALSVFPESRILSTQF
jgi:hypothetical protein